MNSQTTPITVYLENPHTHVYVSPPSPPHSPQTHPNSTSRDSPSAGFWKDIAFAVVCIVCGIILFSLAMDVSYWYWGVISGIGMYILVRTFYGCYMNSADANTKSSRALPPPPSAPDEEDPTPPY
jgi:hypothetical protein